MPKRNAEIWDHFEKCLGAEKIAMCNYCKKNQFKNIEPAHRRGGKFVKSFSH
ncbi:hypothetical protein FEC36_18495 [Acinetobacter baumannii]|nr:hypothetical protein FEC36_18495 [Acinetobacter baumannii]